MTGAERTIGQWPHRRFSLRMQLVAAALLCAAAFPLAASQQDGTPPGIAQSEITFDPDTGRLGGRIDKGTDIADAVTRIGRVAGFGVEVQPGLGALARDVSVDGLTPDAALNRLIRTGSVVIFRSGGGAGDIAKVWIITEGTGFQETANATRALAETEPMPDPRELRLARAVAAREVIALANAATPQAIDRLQDLALGADDPATRRSAISALAGTAPAGSYNLIVYAGLRDPDATVRIEAARATLWIDPHNGPAVIEQAAAREDDPTARDLLLRLARGETVDRVADMSHDRQLR